MTWALLLARWVEFARSSVALPEVGQGKKLRDSVPDLIMLQAVRCALEQLEALGEEQRGLGLDRAEVLLDRHAEALERRWGGAMPEACRELIHDARRALARAASWA